MFKPERLLYSITKSENLPTVIFFCCIHGNENAGYIALQSIIDLLKTQEEQVEGNFYAIFGNQEAFRV
jgi:succinylglutamate desuccinylase